eukprot:gene2709-3905_t
MSKFPSSISVATFNVMSNIINHKEYVPHIACSIERYLHQFDIFQKNNFDILCLNEVSKDYISMLKNFEWIQKEYHMSELSGKPFGNLILSKFPFKSVDYKKITFISRKIVIAEIEFDTDDKDEKLSLYVCSMHLKAGATFYNTRKDEMEQIYDIFKDFKKNSSFIFLGDLNFMFSSEDECIKNGFEDLWTKLRKNEEGYTFDSVSNKMHGELWPLLPFSLQVRLDRILMKSEILEANEICIFANEPIYGKIEETTDYLYYVKRPFRSISSHICDYFSFNLWRDPKEYLFPSDHFGVATKISKK